MAADTHAISCIVGFMDQLWFQQIIFFPINLQQESSSSSSMAASISEEEQLLSNTSSAHTSDTQLTSEENSSLISSIQDDDECNQYDSDDEKEEEETQPKRTLNRSGSGNVGCRHSSNSPSGGRKRRSDMYPVSRRRLSKTMSCKSLCELELEEVKGFMDLGFTFDKQHLDKRMMSVLPGLQRLDLGDPETRNSSHEIEEEEVLNEEEDEEVNKRGNRVIKRPYLSEAWLVKRPDSPLLNLRVPRESTADDMKKHLKYWAKTVASAIQLEC
ncbi:OLC1v1034610C1 [Oldenlandia corymbosa var. corymbosa]|uniref:OLC1v1034610C1 n=1 Tax=Oldenlandia corymbosa var. corymbosa TaxID=529605 RepID=A0AAV1CR35_OLDCO|nr:OLC1v1034610C1 [Oldenlandia corymbosa var. corymbosa]